MTMFWPLTPNTHHEGKQNIHVIVEQIRNFIQSTRGVKIPGIEAI